MNVDIFCNCICSKIKKSPFTNPLPNFARIPVRRALNKNSTASLILFFFLQPTAIQNSQFIDYVLFNSVVYLFFLIKGQLDALVQTDPTLKPSLNRRRSLELADP